MPSGGQLTVGYHSIDGQLAALEVEEARLLRLRRAYETLTGLGYRVEWHEYPMPHSVCAEEIADITAWLGKVLAAVRP